MDLTKRGSKLGETRGEGVLGENMEEGLVAGSEQVVEEKDEGSGCVATEGQGTDAVAEGKAEPIAEGQGETAAAVEREGERAMVGEEGDDVTANQEGPQVHEDGEKHDPDQHQGAGKLTWIRPEDKIEGSTS